MESLLTTASPSSLSWPDLALGVAFALLVANAARRGFMREGSLLLGLGLALWLASRLHQSLGLSLGLAGPDAYWPVLLYVVLALSLLIIAAALSGLAAPVVQRGPFRQLDHLAGLAVGLAEATLVVGLVVLAGQRLGALQPAPHSPTARAAELASSSLAWLSASIPFIQ